MRRRILDSLLGGVLPALVGVVATLLLTSTAQHEPRVALLLVWTIIGYLSLTDFGLTRASSKLASTLDVRSAFIVSRLWRNALPFGTVSAIALAAIGAVSGSIVYALALIPVPLIAALQFPLVGIMEATGRFGYLAVHRILNAVTSYLVPVAVVIILPSQAVLATAAISVARIALFVMIAHRLRVDVIATVRSALAPPSESVPPTKSIVSWLAVSSLLGPLLLYADRFVLALVDGTGPGWVYYAALSEILMRTYIVPTALVAVLFPWLSMRVRTFSSGWRRLFYTFIPAISLPITVVAGISIALLTPDVAFRLLGAQDPWMLTARLVMAFSLSATLLNWISQLQIAVLHALDGHRFVGVFQMSSVVPFIAALLVAAQVGGMAAVAGVAFGRVGITWLALVLRTRRAFRASTPT